MRYTTDTTMDPATRAVSANTTGSSPTLLLQHNDECAAIIMGNGDSVRESDIKHSTLVLFRSGLRGRSEDSLSLSLSPASRAFICVCKLYYYYYYYHVLYRDDDGGTVFDITYEVYR